MAVPVNALHANFDVDYVIVYRFTDTSKIPIQLLWSFYSFSYTAKNEANEHFARLIQALARAGLQIEVRNGDNCSLLVFIKPASDQILNKHVYRSRSAY